MNNVKAIIFDFVGVLMRNKKSALIDPLTNQIDRQIGQVTDDAKFKEDIVQNLGLEIKALSDVWQKIASKYEPVLELWTMLPELKNKYKLAVLNNGTSLTLPYYERLCPINFSIFDEFICSGREGLTKPDEKIYLLACRRLGINPKEALFFDDSVENVEAAKALGMKSFLVSPQTDVAHILKDELVGRVAN